jgi:hypothetical protein
MLEVTPYTFIIIVLALLGSHLAASLLGFGLCYLATRVYNKSASRVMNNLGEEIRLRNTLTSGRELIPEGETGAVRDFPTLDDEIEAEIEVERLMREDPQAMSQMMARLEQRA